MVIGLAAAAVASHAIVAMLFGVSALDPITYVGVVGLLAAVSAIALLGSRMARGAGRSGDHSPDGIVGGGLAGVMVPTGVTEKFDSSGVLLL